MTERVHDLAVVPRDGLFCKDGRGWFTFGSGRAHSLDWPYPTTIRGALCTAWGRELETRFGRTLNKPEWKALQSGLDLQAMVALRRPVAAGWGVAHRLWPVPADAMYREGQPFVERLVPQPPPLEALTIGREDDPARDALWRPRLSSRSKPIPTPRWWSEKAFAAWTSGSGVSRTDRALHPAAPARRFQAHVRVAGATLTAEDGALFAEEVLEALDNERHEFAIGCRLGMSGKAMDASGMPSWATVGGGGRLSSIEAVPDALFAMPAGLPESIAAANSPGIRLIAASPCVFSAGWCPDGFSPRDGEYRGTLPGGIPAVLRAAFVRRPLDLSGYDVAERAPKDTLRLVSPGAVFFLERTVGRRSDHRDAEALWFAAIGQKTNEGLGRVVPAVWNMETVAP